VIVDFDCTPIKCIPRKSARPATTGGFGFDALLISCGREVLAGILRLDNARAGNSADHLRALELALEQFPDGALARPRHPQARRLRRCKS
jgi:hypothetical protein